VFLSYNKKCTCNKYIFALFLRF